MVFSRGKAIQSDEGDRPCWNVKSLWNKVGSFGTSASYNEFELTSLSHKGERNTNTTTEVGVSLGGFVLFGIT